MKPVTQEAIQAKVKVAPNGCWEWQGGRFQQSGYGRMKSGGRAFVAHRLSYEAFVGPIPTGLTLDHLCRNRCCVNPDHLEPVTMRVNVLRGKTITAANAAKTHCNRGHPLSGANLLIRRDGRRRCQECERASQKRLRSKAEYKAKHAAYERERRRKAIVMRYRQQGDVLLFHRDSLPSGARRVDPNAAGKHVLAHGESGHAHVIEATSDVEMYEDSKGTLWLKVAAPSPLVHEEHKPQTIEPGIYEIRRVVEVDPFENEVRTVAD